MLNIVKDLNVTDKWRDSFVSALCKECNLQGVEYQVLSHNDIYDKFDIHTPCVITDPYEHKKPLIYNNADLDTTSHVIFDIIKDIKPSETLLIGRGKIATPLIGMIIEKTNHTLTVANSHTTSEHLQTLIEDADIIINTSTSEIHTNLPMFNKVLIDINNNFKCNQLTLFKDNHYNMSKVGKATVSKIVERAR